MLGVLLGPTTGRTLWHKQDVESRAAGKLLGLHDVAELLARRLEFFPVEIRGPLEEEQALLESAEA